MTLHAGCPMKRLIRRFLAALLHAPLFSAQPNIVLILVDDMGYGDLGCYGHPLAKTPVIDRLAKEGVRFTQHYANGPECSPTRTAFLTGRYQQRAGGLECAIGTGNVGRYDDAIRLAGQRQLGLPAKQVVLPSALKPAGYVSGVFGKWHLGYEPQFNPVEHGWDDFFGYMGGNVHYFNHRETSDLHVLYRGRLPVHTQGYMTHLITDSSINFIERNKDKPFFLYVSHECPHFPFQGPKDVKKEVNKTNWMKPDADTYVAMLEDLDSEVGRLLAALDKHKLADNTLVIYTSDNGPWNQDKYTKRKKGHPKDSIFWGEAGPLRNGKGSPYEAGYRLPCIVRWPGKVPVGRVNDAIFATIDFMPTFANLCGFEVPKDRYIDGINQTDLILGKRETGREHFYFDKAGVRKGKWKYLKPDAHFYGYAVEDDRKKVDELYDLEADLGERTNLATKHPKIVAQLRQLMENISKGK